MKRILLYLLIVNILCNPTISYSQLIFSTFFGGNDYDSFIDMNIDTIGNIYLSGNTQSLNFPTTPGAYHTDPLHDTINSFTIFITKFDPDCTNLIYSTFIGFGNCRCMEIDKKGNSYITGWSGNDYPTTPGAFDRSYGNKNKVFLTKLNISGNALIYSTLLGGNDLGSVGMKMIIDSVEDIFITGNTSSKKFPTTNGAFDISQNGLGFLGDAFVTKINLNNNSLIYSTYIGGTNDDGGTGIKIDKEGNAYVTGETYSNNYPISIGAFDTTINGTMDIFISKLNNNGSGLIFSTYLGGKYEDGSTSIEIDQYDNIYITGGTYSNDYPMSSKAFDRTFSGKRDIFCTKLDSLGDSLIFSTFIGYSNDNAASDLMIDSDCNIYITGCTTSDKYPVTCNAYDTSFNGGFFYDCILTKLSNDGRNVIYSTYLGGNGYDVGRTLFLDSLNNIYIAGEAMNNFPTTKGAYSENINGGTDGFVIKLKIQNNFISNLYDTLNLGDIFINYTKDTTFDIKNYRTAKTGGYINIPSKFSSDTSSFVLDSAATIAIPLHFMGDSTSGSVVDSIEIIDSICGYIKYIYLFANIINIPATATLQTPIIAGCPGDTVEMPIYLKNAKNINESGTTSFTTDLSFNSSLLLPLSEPKGTVTNGIRTIPLNLPLSGITNDTLIKIKFIVGLGNDTITPLTLSNFVSIGGKVNIDTINGYFKLECVCHEGGARLINIDGTLSLTCKPNPVNDIVQFDFETIEDGHTELFISDMLGNKLMRVFESETHGKYSIEADLSLFYVGVYAYTLQTPTARVNKLFIINN
jgi:hypothetical protein